MTSSDEVPADAAQIPAGHLPRWEERYAGRLEWELAALRAAGIKYEIDQHELRNGRLSIVFDWPLDQSTTVRLRALFPDTYPDFRPLVYLLSGLDPVPTRHVSPIEGNICLLGRDTGQWTSRWSLCKLLQMQLADALTDTGDEDPQGEPSEVWWNQLNSGTGSFCLVDTAWDLKDSEKGTLRIRYKPCGTFTLPPPTKLGKGPIVKAYVESILDSSGSEIQRWDAPLPNELATAPNVIEIPWVKHSEIFHPRRDFDEQVKELIAAHPELDNFHAQKFNEALRFKIFAIAHPCELAFKEIGIGWTFIIQYARPNSLKPAGHRKVGKGNKTVGITVIPTYRAGSKDVGWRVPAVSTLAGKRILLVGAGAIGAPIAIELARNGCKLLNVIDHDVVEPGNTIRWPLGASVWGQRKAGALAEFLRQEYPGTDVTPHAQLIGIPHLEPSRMRDDELLEQLLSETDLVIDASASNGVTFLLAEQCREASVPLISAHATPTLEGGAVVRYGGDGGCPVCLWYKSKAGEIDPPPGQGDDDKLTQAPGCGERTFIGADYDIQELSLQTVRLAVETLAGTASTDSVVQTLSFIDDDGNRSLPKWRVDQLTRHPDCSCHK